MNELEMGNDVAGGGTTEYNGSVRKCESTM